MINKQKLSYQLWEEKIPLSKHLLNYLKRIILKNQTLYRMETTIRFYLQLAQINLESFKAPQRN